VHAAKACLTSSRPLNRLVLPLPCMSSLEVVGSACKACSRIAEASTQAGACLEGKKPPSRGKKGARTDEAEGVDVVAQLGKGDAGEQRPHHQEPVPTVWSQAALAWPPLLPAHGCGTEQHRCPTR
jgi:hypothetical protein